MCLKLDVICFSVVAPFQFNRKSLARFYSAVLDMDLIKFVSRLIV